MELILLAEKGDLAAVQQLISSGIDIDAVDDRGRTAVMAATHGNYPSVVKALIDAGANIHIQDNMQDNPFLYAGAEGLLDILRLTIAAGPNTKLVNRYGGSALIPACHHGYPDCVLELLTTTDVDINHVNNLGWTALIEAVILSDGGPIHQRIVQILVDHGADLSIGDNDGVTALDHARRLGYAEMVAILS
ncbi:MAG: ankyrin repeat domain-containing protein [Armatimonadota bacterium]